MKAIVTFVFLLGIYTTNMAQRIPQEPPYEKVTEDSLPALTTGRACDPDFKKLTPKCVYILGDGRALLDAMLYGKIYASKEVLRAYLVEVAKLKGIELSDPPYGIPKPEHTRVSTDDGLDMIDGPPNADAELYQRFGCLAIETSRGNLLVGIDGEEYFELYNKVEYIAYREKLKAAIDKKAAARPASRSPQLWYSLEFPDELQERAAYFLAEIGLPEFEYSFASLPSLDSATNEFRRTYYLETVDYLGLSAILHLVYLAEFDKAEIRMRNRKPSKVKRTPDMDEVPEPVIIDQHGNEYVLTSYFWTALNPHYNGDQEGTFFAVWMPKSKAEYEGKLRDWKHPEYD